MHPDTGGPDIEALLAEFIQESSAHERASTADPASMKAGAALLALSGESRVQAVRCVLRAYAKAQCGPAGLAGMIAAWRHQASVTPYATLQRLGHLLPKLLRGRVDVTAGDIELLLACAMGPRHFSQKLSTVMILRTVETFAEGRALADTTATALARFSIWLAQRHAPEVVGETKETLAFRRRIEAILRPETSENARDGIGRGGALGRGGTARH